jgi:hypothetical protein
VLHQAPRDLPLEASLSPVLPVESLATSPMTSQTRRLLLHPRGHLL